MPLVSVVDPSCADGSLLEAEPRAPRRSYGYRYQCSHNSHIFTGSCISTYNCVTPYHVCNDGDDVGWSYKKNQVGVVLVRVEIRVECQ